MSKYYPELFETTDSGLIDVAKMIGSAELSARKEGKSVQEVESQIEKILESRPFSLADILAIDEYLMAHQSLLTGEDESE